LAAANLSQEDVMKRRALTPIKPTAKTAVKTIVACSFVLLLGSFLSGCEPPAVAPEHTFVWSVKMRCRDEITPINLPGVGFDPAAQDSRRFERTEVNVHNFLEVPLEFRYKAVSPRTSVGSASCISSKVRESLAANEARALTCGDFQSLLQGSQCPQANEGFLAIESTTELQVVGVYTEQLLREALYHAGRALAAKNYGGPPIPPESLPLTPLNPQTEEVPLTVKLHAELEKVTAIGAGLGLGVGTGVGVGAGVSIDVEYITPKKIPRRRN
jgi:hypothetical protein